MAGLVTFPSGLPSSRSFGFYHFVRPCQVKPSSPSLQTQASLPLFFCSLCWMRRRRFMSMSGTAVLWESGSDVASSKRRPAIADCTTLPCNSEHNSQYLLEDLQRKILCNGLCRELQFPNSCLASIFVLAYLILLSPHNHVGCRLTSASNLLLIAAYLGPYAGLLVI